MPEFDATQWTDPSFARGFVDEADFFILERHRLIAVVLSAYRHFIRNGPRPRRLLELGSGDGRHTQELLDLDSEAEATLVDGSEEMLAAARRRLAGRPGVRSLRRSFEALMQEDDLAGEYDFICSSLAIHHLPLEGKRAFFAWVHRRLAPGGVFLVTDVVLAPSPAVEAWHLELWREWLRERFVAGADEKDHTPIVQKHVENPDDLPDTLADQLEGLKSAGFVDVASHYQYGIFAVFGGRKAERP